MASFKVPARFNGPPEMGNGGYCAGLIAKQIGQTVTVRLRSPLPLESELQLAVVEQGSWQVRAGETVVASAAPGHIDLTPPSPPTLEQAQEASSRYVGLGDSVFTGYTGCFVCGVRRARHDGLRIFPGTLPGSDVVAAPLLPEPSLADADGNLPPEVVWAALDCPGYFAIFPGNEYALLGELHVRIDRLPRADQPHVVVGWPVDRQGRKRRAGTALFDTQGELLAIGLATWIEVKA